MPESVNPQYIAPKTAIPDETMRREEAEDLLDENPLFVLDKPQKDEKEN